MNKKDQIQVENISKAVDATSAFIKAMVPIVKELSSEDEEIVESPVKRRKKKKVSQKAISSKSAAKEVLLNYPKAKRSTTQFQFPPSTADHQAAIQPNAADPK